MTTAPGDTSPPAAANPRVHAAWSIVPDPQHGSTMTLSPLRASNARGSCAEATLTHASAISARVPALKCRGFLAQSTARALRLDGDGAYVTKPNTYPPKPSTTANRIAFDRSSRESSSPRALHRATTPRNRLDTSSLDILLAFLATQS
jgi:hypothetical protein